MTVTGITPAAAAALSLRLVAQATEAPPAGPAANFKFTREIGRLPAADSDSDSDSDSDLNDGRPRRAGALPVASPASGSGPGHGKGFPRRRACLCQPPTSSTSNRDLPWS